jgi:choline dehydrogenase-like flavoprotein
MSNLFIAGGSVFPTGGVAPPTLTIVALSLRLASYLKQNVFRLGPARSGT